MTLFVNTATNQYCLREPAHRYWQGGRCVYYFALDLQSLDGLLPQRVDEDLTRDANRRLTPSHAKGIQEYLRDRKDWLLGAMLLGVSPNAVEFHPYKDENGMANPNFGELRILANLRNTMRIFDGQHRRRAIGDLLREKAEAEGDVDPHLDSLLKASVPVVLYAEESLSDLRQMFVDASQTKKIEANTVVRFDRRSAFNLAAIHADGQSKLFGGRIEMERTTVSRTSQCILSVNQLADILKTVDVGNGGRVSRDRNDGHMLNLPHLYRRCMIWADEFLPAARIEYEGLVNGSFDRSDIPQLRAKSLALSVTVIRILAGCYQLWLRESNDWQPLADFVRQSSLNIESQGQTLLVDAGIVAAARRQEVQGAIDYIVAEARREASS